MSLKGQISFFPYIGLPHNNSCIEFDNIYVWNVDTDASNWISDPEIRKYALKLIAANKRMGQPISGIGGVRIKGIDAWAILTEGQNNRIDEFRKVLFICSVSELNTRGNGHGMVTAENLTHIRQNFILNDKYTGYTRGRIIRITDSGYKVGDIVYEVPNYIMNSTIKIDLELMKSLDQIRKNSRSLYRKMLRAIDAMMNGYRNTEDISYESIVLEEARAFEILFDLPESSPRKVFKEKIVKYCQDEKYPRRYYSSETFTFKSGIHKKKELGSRHQMWADKFYVLRNHIIHGEIIRNRDYMFFGQMHFDLGLWFFIVALKKILDENLDRKEFYDSIGLKSKQFVYDKGHFKGAKGKKLLEVMYPSMSK